MILRRILFIVFFILAMIGVYVYNAKKIANDETYANTKLAGRIIKISRSSNHNFGIYLIAIDSSVGVTTSHSHRKDGFLAFQVRNDTAEIYSTVGIEDSVGYYLNLNGFTKEITVKNNRDKIISRRNISSVHDGINLNFITEKTIMNAKTKPFR